MKIKYVIILLIVLQINGLTASAQTWLWGADGGNTLKADVWVSNVATNKTGNVYQTGDFESSISFGSINFTSQSGAFDAFLVKYDPNGNVLWARQSMSTVNGAAAGLAVASDDEDNAYVTGFAGDTTTIGTETFDNPISFLMKYDADGNIKWLSQLPDYVYEGNAVATDESGHEYVTGGGLVLIKYDDNGNIIWTIGDGNESDIVQGYGVATDNSGNIYVSGVFDSILTLGNYQLNAGTGEDMFVAKFDNNGNVIWAQQGVGGYCGVSYVAVSNKGSVYVTGPFSDTINLGSYTVVSTPNDSTYSLNFFVAKYSADGNVEWAKQDFSADNSWTIFSICADNYNHIYVSGGLFQGFGTTAASFMFANDSIGVILPPDDYDNPSFLMKLDTNGDVICSTTLPGGAEETNAVTSDLTGNFVYLGGVFTASSLTFGNDILSNNSGVTDSYVGRWQACLECDTQSVTISKQGDTLTSSIAQGNQWVANNTELPGVNGRSFVASVDGWYKVIYTNPATGCTYISDSIYITGFTQASTGCIFIYPNPTFNTVFVNMCPTTAGASSYNLKVMDELGRVVGYLPALNYSNEIDLYNLPAAMYFISVTNGTDRTVVPIVKLTN